MWAIEPRYEFERVEPVLDADPMEGGHSLHRAGRGGVLPGQNRKRLGCAGHCRRPPGAGRGVSHQPLLLRHGPPIRPGRAVQRGTGREYDAQLAALGSTFRMEVGHGGRARWYLWDQEAGQVLRIQVNEGSFGSCRWRSWKIPCRRCCPFGGACGTNRPKPALGRSMIPSSQRKTACTRWLLPRAGCSLILCTRTPAWRGGAHRGAEGGKWGYVNGEGREVIPCEYEGFWGPRWQWSEAAGGPVCEEANLAPCTGGCVVVRKNGETGVLRADGSVLLGVWAGGGCGPAQGGLFVGKTEGRWGALRLPEK